MEFFPPLLTIYAKVKKEKKLKKKKKKKKLVLVPAWSMTWLVSHQFELGMMIEMSGIINEMAGSGECFKCHY